MHIWSEMLSSSQLADDVGLVVPLIQPDQINMAVFFWYLVESDLSNVRCCTWCYFLQGTRNTQPCLSGQVVYLFCDYLLHDNMAVYYFWQICQKMFLFRQDTGIRVRLSVTRGVCLRQELRWELLGRAVVRGDGQ